MTTEKLETIAAALPTREQVVADWGIAHADLDLSAPADKLIVADKAEAMGGDVARNIAELEAAVRAAQNGKGRTADVSLPGNDRATVQPDGSTAYHLTDTGNAQRLVDYCGERSRYCAALKMWFIFDEKRWAPDDSLLIEDLAGEALRGIYEEASQSSDDKERTALARWALGSESAQRRRAAVEVARSDRRVAARPRDFDRNGALLNCQNGTLNLRTGELRAHESGDMLSKIVPVAYEPEARSELWERVVLEACGGDAEYAAYLQRFYGYCSSAEIREEVFAVQFGPTQTGKNTVNDAVRLTLGADYAAAINASTLLKESRSQATRDDLLRLDGKYLGISAEASRGARFDDGLLKMFTGEATVTMRGLYHVPREFRPTAKLVLHTNHIPELPDDDDAVWRRAHVQPFVHRPERIDPHIKATLQDVPESGPAILAWLVRGHLSWRERGLDPPEVVRKATADLRITMNPLFDFFEQCCTFDPGLWCSRASLRATYQAWCKDGNAPRRLAERELYARIRNKGGKDDDRTVGSKTTRGFAGIGLPGG